MKRMKNVINPGDKVICTDDTGWLIPDPEYDHLAPKKGKIYTVRDYARFHNVGAISLVEGDPGHFYRACRFDKRESASQSQLDGLACVICGRDDLPMIPAGESPRGAQMFACSEHRSERCQGGHE